MSGNCKLKIANCKLKIEGNLAALRSASMLRGVMLEAGSSRARPNLLIPICNLQFAICNLQSDLPGGRLHG
jgi:hypothetical protein